MIHTQTRTNFNKYQVAHQTTLPGIFRSIQSEEEISCENDALHVSHRFAQLVRTKFHALNSLQAHVYSYSLDGLRDAGRGQTTFTSSFLCRAFLTHGGGVRRHRTSTNTCHLAIKSVGCGSTRFFEARIIRRTVLNRARNKKGNRYYPGCFLCTLDLKYARNTFNTT